MYSTTRARHHEPTAIMTCRRDDRASETRRKWLTKHPRVLMNCRIPEEIYLTEMHWIRLLEAGSGYEKDWHSRRLTPDKAATLRTFIIKEYGHGEYHGILLELAHIPHRDT